MAVVAMLVLLLVGDGGVVGGVGISVGVGGVVEKLANAGDVNIYA